MNNRQMSEALKDAGRQIPHPGEVLKELFMDEYGISGYELAKKAKLGDMTISDIINGKRAISTETAICLGECFNTDAQSWLNLQSRFEIQYYKFCRAERFAGIEHLAAH